MSTTYILSKNNNIKLFTFLKSFAQLYGYILCKINLAIFGLIYIFDHLRAILDISLIQITRTVSLAHDTVNLKTPSFKKASGTTNKFRTGVDAKFSTIEHNANS